MSKLGEFIELVDERNTYLEVSKFMGLNRYKEFMPTVATVDNVDPSKYKIVRKNMFVFSGMQTGRDNVIRIGLSEFEEPFLISPAYTTFYVKNIIPEYFFMIFKSVEMDRYGSFLSDSSVRANLDWERFCDIDIEIPSIEKQKQVVRVYLALFQNQKKYEQGLDDLKLVCDAYIEDLRRKHPIKRIGTYIDSTNRKNTNPNCKIQGISNKQVLIDSESRTEGVDVLKYLEISPNEFGYSPIHINDGSIALNTSNKTYCLSPIYATFKTSVELTPKYLMLWFGRKEFIRYTWFHAFGSARDSFDWEQMCEVEIPIPNISVQRSISDIFDVYNNRNQINERLKNQISEICPVLIRGSLIIRS
jgi:type I restriction enzyme S subunit